MKKAILVVSFGTSYEEARRRCIESVETRIQEQFTEFVVHRAFTSNFIINKLRDREGIHVDSVKEALDKLKNDGIKELYIQPLHIIPGYEYDKLKSIVTHYKNHSFEKFKLGKPLLYDMEDYVGVVSALESQTKEMEESDLVLFMGHGTDHFANGLYMCLQYFINQKGLNYLIGNIENYPRIDDLLPTIKKMNVKSINVIPLLLVAGDHVHNDMAGEDKDSWVNKLKSDDYKVDIYIKGLGENEMIQSLFVQKLRELIGMEENNE